MSYRILIVEDEESLGASLRRVLIRDGYEVDVVYTGESALEIFSSYSYDIVLTDIILPGMDGIELLRKIKEQKPDQIVIIMTAFASLETSIEALRAGAYDYIIKPLIHDEVKQVIRNALKQRTLQSENIILKRQIKRIYDFSNIVCESLQMKRIVEEVKKIADAKSNILILGETGTGKELFARAVHFSSNRADRPFIPINCSAIPENLLETELFGYVKGAFTGATSSKKGLFEVANGGTVFLDEIGNLSMSLQAKLLRVIEDREIRPVGGTQSIKVDLRFISATNIDIEKTIREGRFREDLYYRINIITIKLPPLRERKEDIEPLVRFFIKRYSDEIGKKIIDIDDNALRVLKDYSWPGNVRELQNIIERAVLIADDSVLRTQHLPENLKARGDFLSYALENRLSIEDYTKAFILKYQDLYNEQQIADMLGITRKSLWEKRKRWGIQRKKT